jgi:hypothetical protein
MNWPSNSGAAPASEAEYLTGQSTGSEYWGLAVERFLMIVEDEVGGTPAYTLTPAPRLSWMWHHQTRISLLSLIAAKTPTVSGRTTGKTFTRKKKPRD